MKRGQRGSISIEATISLTAYIFLIVTIFSFIKLCRAQMIVSLAVDSAAKEISQYAYFYEITGFEKVMKTTDQYAKAGRDKTNKLIDGTKTFTSSLMNLGDSLNEGWQQGVSDVQNVASATSIDQTVSQIEQAVKGFGQSAESIQSNTAQFVSAAKGLESTFKNMDLEAYLRSMAALGASTVSHAVLSRLICAPIAKSFAARHIAAYSNDTTMGTWDRASAVLEGLGVEEGMDGLNFLMSEMFAEGHEKEIHLVCYYSIDFKTLIEVPFETRMVFCKEALTKAWLGGYQKSSE